MFLKTGSVQRYDWLAVSPGEDSRPLDVPAPLAHVPTEVAEITPESRVVVHSDPRGPGADRFRLLRLRLSELSPARKLRSLLVTSPLPGDGKSTVCLNVATILAEGGTRRVAVIEADLYHPTLGSVLGLPSHTGLAEYLENGGDPMDSLRRIEPLNWYLLAAGRPKGVPTDLLQPDRLVALVQQLSSLFDWILFDAPPLIPLTDAAILSRHTDASLLVTRAGRTPHQAVENALAILPREHVVGVLLNGAEGVARQYFEYYGHYGGL